LRLFSDDELVADWSIISFRLDGRSSHAGVAAKLAPYACTTAACMHDIAANDRFIIKSSGVTVVAPWMVLRTYGTACEGWLLHRLAACVKVLGKA
jgi:hypothetical protein